MKDRTNFWWKFHKTHSLVFYGAGISPTDHNTGNSTPVVKAKVLNDGKTIAMQTQSGSLYAVSKDRLVPNGPSFLLLSRLLGE